MLTIDLYDGTADLEDYLGVYKAQMYIQDIDDADYYRYFPTTLKGVAQSWSNGHPSESVTCFQDLADKFVSKFIANRKERRTYFYLSKIKPGPQESLAKFVKRFHQEVVLIPDVEDRVACTSFLNGLRSRCFKFSLAGQKEITSAKALRKAADFICATEIYADNSDALNKARIPGDKNLNHGDKDPFETIDPRFTAEARSILMEVRGHPMLRRPPPMTAPPKPQNARKYCEFYEHSGHTTTKCRS